MIELVPAPKTANPGASNGGSIWRGALLIGAALILCGCVTDLGYESPSFYGEVSAGDVYEAPPPLPLYAQPSCPGDGYLWVPGYWAYSGGYYWVPGTWVLPPQIGFLWTPGYWGFAGGAYVWHAGYWGPHVGFYGGVHYGFGYDGDGYAGGRWEGRHFVYNRYVTNVNENVVHYTYSQRVSRGEGDRVSYNGGRGGLVTRPTRRDRVLARETHVPATFSQQRHVREAARNPALFFRENGGRPSIAATPRAASFSGAGVERARGAERFEPRVERPSLRQQLNHPVRPEFQARPNFQGRPELHARPNEQARPNFRARPNFQARPNVQQRPQRLQRRPMAQPRGGGRQATHRGPPPRPQERRGSHRAQQPERHDR
jgi:WXXGXW repeat (2 copies)